MRLDENSVLVGGGEGGSSFNGRLHKVDVNTGTFSTVDIPGGRALHVVADPSLPIAYTMGLPGTLYRVNLSPFGSPGVPLTLTGDDPLITHITFTPGGTVFYTSSDERGFGNFGIIDLMAQTTTRLMTGLAAAHGMAYDETTNLLLLSGSNMLVQIDPMNPSTIVDQINVQTALEAQGSVFPDGMQLDIVVPDQDGNLFISNNFGDLIFMDYSNSGRVSNSRFLWSQFLAENLDDIDTFCPAL